MTRTSLRILRLLLLCFAVFGLVLARRVDGFELLVSGLFLYGAGSFWLSTRAVSTQLSTNGQQFVVLGSRGPMQVHQVNDICGIEKTARGIARITLRGGGSIRVPIRRGFPAFVLAMGLPEHVVDEGILHPTVYSDGFNQSRWDDVEWVASSPIHTQ